MPLRRQNLSGPFNGLLEKIGFIRRAYEQSLSHPEVRAFAENAAGRGPRPIQVARLFSVLRDVTNYIKDPVGKEYTKAPWVIVEEMRRRGCWSGDCDDQTSINYALLKSIGIPSYIKVGWFNQDENPGHIWVMANPGSGWVAFDTTTSALGKEHPFTKSRLYP